MKLMVLVLLFIAAFIVALTGGAREALAISLKPGNYEIKNWIELPDGGSSKTDRTIEFIDGVEKINSKLAKESGCKTV